MKNAATVQRLRISVVELQRVPSSVLHGSKVRQIQSRNGDTIFHHKPLHWLAAIWSWSCERSDIVIIGVVWRKKQIIREDRVNFRIVTVALNVVEV